MQAELLGALVFFAVFCGSWITLKWAIGSGIASRIAMDDPNHRSLHQSPTPRGAGLFFLPWTLAVGVIFGAGWPVVFLAAVLMLLSLVDDSKGLPVALRLGTHFLIALAVSLTVPFSGWVMLLLATLFIAWVTNLYNFMDGSDGLAGTMSVVGFGSYAWVAWSAGQPALTVLSITLVAGALAFLLFNFPPARIFLGDSGSIPIGFLAGAIGFVGWRENVWPSWFPVLVFSPFIFDATITLLRRLLRRERFWEAHREHGYQRLIRMGWSHGRLLRVETLLMAGCAVTAICLLRANDTWTFLVLASWVALYFLFFAVIEAKWRLYVRDMKSP
jgi:UDP-GlcNAc:undecaprenyl-phosphate GlcNAc-1-phosphate transferase